MFVQSFLAANAASTKGKHIATAHLAIDGEKIDVT